ncbi:MAG TPA: hypothetical protein VGG92_22565 [Caulobacteraceae bacterium]|jgi:hypothetical protein
MLLLGGPAQAAPAPAADTPATTVSPLTVTGEIPRLSRPAMSRAIDHFVRAREIATRVDRVARWREPICVETLGLPEAMNAAITRRIVQAGASIGAPPPAPPHCTANVEVVFTAQPQAFIDLVARRRWILLGYHYASQTERISRITHPIQAWYVTGTRAYSNGTAAVVGTMAQTEVGSGQIAIDDPMGRAPSGEAGTRFSTSLQSEFANVLIVVDQAKVAGQSTDAIADYVAVLAFAPVANLDACNPLPSILDLFAACAPPRVPQSLTASDLAYLKALYAADTRLEVSMVRSQIGTNMMGALKPR